MGWGTIMGTIMYPLCSTIAHAPHTPLWPLQRTIAAWYGVANTLQKGVQKGQMQSGVVTPESISQYMAPFWHLQITPFTGYGSKGWTHHDTIMTVWSGMERPWSHYGIIAHHHYTPPYCSPHPYTLMGNTGAWQHTAITGMATP